MHQPAGELPLAERGAWGRHREEGYECSVCHEPCFDTVNQCLTTGAHKSCHVTTFPCGHKFHTGCILPWLARSNTCPTCRHTVEEEINPAATPDVDARSGAAPSAQDTEKKFLQKALEHEKQRAASSSPTASHIRRARRQHRQAAAHALIRPFSKQRAQVQIGFADPGELDDWDQLILKAAAVSEAPPDAVDEQADAAVAMQLAVYEFGADTRAAISIQAAVRGYFVRKQGVRRVKLPEREPCATATAAAAKSVADWHSDRVRRSSFGSDCSADSSNSDSTFRSSGGDSSSSFELDIEFSSDPPARRASMESPLDTLISDADLATQIAVSATRTRPAASTNATVDGRPQPVDGIVAESNDSDNDAEHESEGDGRRKSSGDSRVSTSAARRSAGGNRFAHQFECPEIGRVIIAKRPVQDPRIRTTTFTDEQILRMTAELEAMRRKHLQTEPGPASDGFVSDPDDRPSSREDSSSSDEPPRSGSDKTQAQGNGSGASQPGGDGEKKIAQLLPMLEIEAQLAMDSTLFTEKSSAPAKKGKPQRQKPVVIGRAPQKKNFLEKIASKLATPKPHHRGISP
eukprot:SAG31_NODE_207_length_20316_cov_20.465400_6_plen_575_part_00